MCCSVLCFALVVAQATCFEKDNVDALTATAQGYYNSDNTFNFYRQARAARIYLILRPYRADIVSVLPALVMVGAFRM